MHESVLEVELVALHIEPTDMEYTYKGCLCKVFSPAELGEQFDGLLAEVIHHAQLLAKNGVILLDMNEFPSRFPFDFAMCDKEEPDYFVLLADFEQAYPFHVAHELVHLLPSFYEIDKWGLLQIEGRQIGSWPLFEKCIRRIEHLLSDIHVDAEAISRGFLIDEHFPGQVRLGLPVWTTQEVTLDFYDKVRAATNYLQCKYQVKNSLAYGYACGAAKMLFEDAEEAMRTHWPYSFKIASLMNERILIENFFEGFDRTKFERICDKAIVMLHLLGVPGPTVQFQ